MHTGASAPTNDTLRHLSTEELYRMVRVAIEEMAHRYGETAPSIVASEFTKEMRELEEKDMADRKQRGEP